LSKQKHKENLPEDEKEWMAMCLELPKAEMIKDLFDDFGLVYNQDHSHVVQTAGDMTMEPPHKSS